MIRAAFLTAALLLPVTAQATPDDLATTVLARLAQVPARRATFQEERQFAALNVPLRSSGTLEYRQPSYLEKVTLEPKPERLVVNGASLSITEGSAAPRVLDLDAHPALRALVDTMRAPLEGDLASLRDNYRLQADGDLSHWRLMLTPARPALARFVRSVTLEGLNNVVRTIRIVQPNGDVQTMTIQIVP